MRPGVPAAFRPAGRTRREFSRRRLREVGGLGTGAGRAEAGQGLPCRREGPTACCLLLGAHDGVPEPGLPGRDPAALILLARQQHPAQGMGRGHRASPGKIDLGIRNGAPPRRTQPVRRHGQGQFGDLPRLWYFDDRRRTSASTRRRSASATCLYAVLDIDDGSPNVPCTDGRGGRGRRKAGHGTAGRTRGDTGRDIAAARRAMMKSQFRILRISSTASTPSAGSSTTASSMSSALCARRCAPHTIRCSPKGWSLTAPSQSRLTSDFCVDRIADYDSSFTSWVPGGEFHATHFHAKPSQWYGTMSRSTRSRTSREAGRALSGGSNWRFAHCSASSDTPATVQRGDAQSLAFPDDTFDAVIVDPPYYDAIQYGDLSDFFYVWLKRSIGHLYPGVFGTPLTPKQQEVIESRADKKSPEYISHEEFERRLQRALGEMARVVKRDGMVAIVFAHTDVEAWERLLRALRSANLVVTTSWPMRSEREARSTAHDQRGPRLFRGARLPSPAVPRRRASTTTWSAALEDRIAERLDAFEEMGLVGADYFVSAIGPAFEVFAQYSRVVKLSGEEVGVPELMVLARQAVARHAMRRLLGPDSLARAGPGVAVLPDLAVGLPRPLRSRPMRRTSWRGRSTSTSAACAARAGSRASRARTSPCSVRRTGRASSYRPHRR